MTAARITSKVAPNPTAPSHWPSVPWLMTWTIAMVLIVGILTYLSASETTVPLLIPKNTSTPDSGLGNALLRWLLLAHLSLFKIYPWLLLAPWLVRFTARFHLERGRLRTSLPAQLAACLASIAGARLLNDHVGSRQPDLVVFAVSESVSDPGTNDVRQYQAHAVVGHERWRSTNPPPLGRDLERLDAHFRRALQELPGRPPSLSSSLHTTPNPRIQEVDDAEIVTRTPAEGAPPKTTATWELKHTRRLLLGSSLWAPENLSDFLFHFFAYGSLVGLAHALHYRREFHERAHRALALETSLARTRLHALQAQLQPHFLFNALNSVIALLRQNPRAAEEMLVSLSDLLRVVLGQAQHQETTLHDELHFLDLYMEIQQLRFGDRLRYTTHVEPSAQGCRLPTLLLQPLVENAVRHGIEPSGRPGHVRLIAHCHDGRLRLEVRDDGIGTELFQGQPPRLGVGLSNVQARLSSFFGDNASMSFAIPTSGGFLVTLDVPANPLPAPPTPPPTTACP